jgi:hypothetical protein
MFLGSERLEPKIVIEPTRTKDVARAAGTSMHLRIEPRFTTETSVVLAPTRPTNRPGAS